MSSWLLQVHQMFPSNHAPSLDIMPGTPWSLVIACGHVGVEPKIGVPQNGWFIMENPIKMNDLGGPPLFLETPMWPSWPLVELNTMLWLLRRLGTWNPLWPISPEWWNCKGELRNDASRCHFNFSCHFNSEHVHLLLVAFFLCQPPVMRAKWHRKFGWHVAVVATGVPKWKALLWPKPIWPIWNCQLPWEWQSELLGSSNYWIKIVVA